ncbi:MAG: hypothetical protein LBM71_05525 [Elusimicrobiota bacterium]|jgi:hypothetical protein|nr:hypothetical protein [Elusimicrobiota bacterium]
MKGPKIVRQKETNLQKAKKSSWLIGAAAVCVGGLFFAAMPMANIPGLGRLPARLGLTDSAMRNLTLSDLAAYAVGVEGNKVSRAQSSYYDGFTGGGISPISIVSQNRLLNAREAYLREYQLTGQPPVGVAGPLSMAQYPGVENYYEGVNISNDYFGDANAPIIAPPQLPKDTYGEPLLAKLGNLGSSSNVQLGKKATKGLSSKPVGAGNIVGKAASDDYFSKSLDNASSKLKGGRLEQMGTGNVITGRVNVSQQAPSRFGAYPDLGKAYFYSANAATAGYKTVAMQLAAAAFDGQKVSDETLVTPGEGEDKVLNSLEPPNTTIEEAEKGTNACREAKEAYQSSIAQMRKTFGDFRQTLLNIGKDYDHSMPGCCESFVGLGKKTKTDRATWNTTIDAMEQTCNAVKNMEAAYAGKCGFGYNPNPVKECADLPALKVLGGCDVVINWNCVNNVKHNRVPNPFTCNDKTGGEYACKTRLDNWINDVTTTMLGSDGQGRQQ